MLIKAVAQAVPTYAMSVFKLPLSVYHDLDTIISRFWWGTQGGSRGVHWVKWAQVCQRRERGGLGFRNLEWFNQAMLAKMGWRLLQNENSLVHMVLKAKYFAGGTFMQATVKQGSSFTWRSIAGARWVLEEGLRWRIGNGTRVSVWGDKWLPSGSTNRPITPKPQDMVDPKVSELIQGEIGQWDVNKLQLWFMPEDVATILTIPISRALPEDIQLWNATPHGKFTVSSAYRLIAERNNLAQGESSSGYPMAKVWRAVWKVQLPNNIKVFTWRALHNALPTLVNLERRKISQSIWCPRCKLQAETVLHAIWECDEVANCWSESTMAVNYKLHFGDFTQLVWEIFEKQGVEGLETFMSISYQIWVSRNRLAFEGILMAPSQIFKTATRERDEYKSILLTKSPSITRSIPKWRAPEGEMYKLNFDGALFKTLTSAGIGVIIRNSEGLPMASMMSQKPNVTDPLAAEQFAAMKGLQLAHDIGITRLILEGDSANTIKALQENDGEYSWLGNVIKEAKQLLHGLEAWELSTIGREANNVAHLLARNAQYIHEDHVLMEDLPVFVQQQLIFDVTHYS